MLELLDLYGLIETLKSHPTIPVGSAAGCPGEIWFFVTCAGGEIVFPPIDTCILAVSLVTASLSGLYLWQLARREARQDRLLKLSGTALDQNQNVQLSWENWYRRLGSAVAASPIVGIAEQRRLLEVLAAAGIKRHGSLPAFIAAKLCCAVGLGCSLWIFLTWHQWFAGLGLIRLAVLVAGLMLGWRLPDITLSRLAARRRLRIEQGLPDALDLLVICAEAGLSLDQSIEEVSRDIRTSSPEVADEFATTAAEMRVLPNRSEALDNLVRRTGLDSLSSITATLSQAIRFGTPLTESMRVLAAEMRTTRLARIEERAARLPVLLAIPLMMFILPSLLMVIGAPVALRVLDSLAQIFK
jgi:tight adherence protein C